MALPTSPIRPQTAAVTPEPAGDAGVEPAWAGSPLACRTVLALHGGVLPIRDLRLAASTIDGQSTRRESLSGAHGESRSPTSLVLSLNL